MSAFSAVPAGLAALSFAVQGLKSLPIVWTSLRDFGIPIAQPGVIKLALMQRCLGPLCCTPLACGDSRLKTALERLGLEEGQLFEGLLLGGEGGLDDAIHALVEMGFAEVLGVCANVSGVPGGGLGGADGFD
jgi:hypothetical protein